jgi:hypothetical protein
MLVLVAREWALLVEQFVALIARVHPSTTSLTHQARLNHAVLLPRLALLAARWQRMVSISVHVITDIKVIVIRLQRHMHLQTHGDINYWFLNCGL